MLVERFFTPELAQVAYVVGDPDVGEVALIDPRRDVDEYVDWCRQHGLRIVGVLETHVHADFVSGAPELAGVTGAPVYASRLGNQEFDHIPVDDGFTLDIGTVRPRLECHRTLQCASPRRGAQQRRFRLRSRQ